MSVPISEIISIHTNTPENAYHITTHVHWACMCWYEQKADCLLGSQLLSCRKNYRGRTAMVKSKTRDFFAWTDEVKRIRKVTRKHKL